MSSYSHVPGPKSPARDAWEVAEYVRLMGRPVANPYPSEHPALKYRPPAKKDARRAYLAGVLAAQPPQPVAYSRSYRSPHVWEGLSASRAAQATERMNYYIARSQPVAA